MGGGTRGGVVVAIVNRPLPSGSNVPTLTGSAVVRIQI